MFNAVKIYKVGTSLVGRNALSALTSLTLFPTYSVCRGASGACRALMRQPSGHGAAAQTEWSVPARGVGLVGGNSRCRRHSVSVRKWQPPSAAMPAECPDRDETEGSVWWAAGGQRRRARRGKGGRFRRGTPA